MEKLPDILETDGNKYPLSSYKSEEDDGFFGWWCFQYVGHNGMPIEAHDGNSWYYLTAFEPTYEEAYADLLERITNMKGVKHC